eukprot:1161973-Pelagomonas_calceolata.AAC.18
MSHGCCLRGVQVLQLGGGSTEDLGAEHTRALAANNAFADGGRVDSLPAHKKSVAGAAKKLEAMLADASKDAKQSTAPFALADQLNLPLSEPHLPHQSTGVAAVSRQAQSITALSHTSQQFSTTWLHAPYQSPGVTAVLHPEPPAALESGPGLPAGRKVRLVVMHARVALETRRGLPAGRKVGHCRRNCRCCRWGLPAGRKVVLVVKGRTTEECLFHSQMSVLHWVLHTALETGLDRKVRHVVKGKTWKASVSRHALTVL